MSLVIKFAIILKNLTGTTMAHSNLMNLWRLVYFIGYNQEALQVNIERAKFLIYLNCNFAHNNQSFLV